jgi:hypothetical protein
MTVTVSTESARGCGFRKPDKTGVGIYLVAPRTGHPCMRLPLPLHACPTCSGGIKPSRSWTWFEPVKFFAAAPPCPLESKARPGRMRQLDVECRVCFAGHAMPTGRHGLLWIGEGFYRSPHDFMAEARTMGVSRKVSAVPKGFKLGETIVYLAHRLAIPVPVSERVPGEPTEKPGVFSIFKPAGVDLVIDDEKNVPERAVKLAEQIGEGARIVKVVRAE